MNLQIRNPRAYELAQKVADLRNTSMTDAVIGALEAEIERLDKHKMIERVRAISSELVSKAGPNGREMTKDEIGRMWGHD